MWHVYSLVKHLFYVICLQIFTNLYQYLYDDQLGWQFTAVTTIQFFGMDIVELCD